MNGKPLTKTQTIAALSERANLTKQQTKETLEALVALAYEEAVDGFTIPGLGKLVIVDRKARMGRNPQTGEPIHIPAKKALKFRIAKAARDACMG